MNYMEECIQANLVPFIQSSPGIGKSALGKLISKKYKLKLIDHRLSTSAPEDLSGLPRFDEKGHARFAPFADLFPLEDAEVPEGMDGWLLFLDEFNSASKSVQAAAYRLILDREVGQHKLHPRVAIICAGNLSTDRAIVNNLSTAMQSRLVHIHMVHDFDQWLMDVAIPQHYDARIIAFLNQNPSKLMDFRPDHNDRTFCCPRTWEFMNALVKDKEVNNDRAALFAGTVTTLVATEFVQFCKVFEHLVKIEDILADPENCRLPTDNPTMWACVASLSEKITTANFEKLCIYVNRLPMTFKVLFFRTALQRYPEIRSQPALINALNTLSAYLFGNDK